MEIKNFDAVISAFCGAFFAYLFMTVKDISTKIYEQGKQNFNALIRVENFCCEIIDAIYVNIQIIEDFHNTAKQFLEQKKIGIYGNMLRKFPFPDDILLGLTNVDFANKILSYKIDFTRINQDIEFFNRMYECFKGAYVQGKIDADTFQINTQAAIEKTRELKKILQGLIEKTVKIAAFARVMRRDKKPFLIFITQPLFKEKIFTSSFNKKAEAEINRFKKDMNEASFESQREIDKIKASE